MELTHEDYYTALDIYFDRFYTIDDEERPIYLPTHTKTEKEIFMEQAKNNLSTEAKEVMNLLLNAPLEIMEELTTVSGKLSIRSIRKYLRECCMPQNTITDIFFELKELKKDLEEGI